MYLPTAFREDRREVLHEAIRAHPLGTLVTAGEAGIMANLIPFELVTGAGGDVLRAHLARNNPQADELRAARPVLVVFQGPQGYVSPSWYATKRETGRVVPTWNYVMVQARGLPVVHDEPAWIEAQVTALTDRHERVRPAPWKVSDAPAPYLAGQLTAIVGLEIPVAALEGKWKVSQNQPDRNGRGVAEGLREAGPSRLADTIDAFVRDPAR